MTATGADGATLPLSITLFGPCEVRLHGSPLPRLRSRKGYWLLALLILRQGREVERSWLAGTLWPDNPEAQAFASLRNSLKDLRRALGSEAGRLRSPTPRSLALDLAGAHVDLLDFDAAIARGDAASLAHAVALYRGTLLEGCAEEWVSMERQAREERYLVALETLAAQAKASRDLAAAVRYLRRVMAVDPPRESAQRALMETLAAEGDYAAVTQTYRELRLLLHRELNAGPSPETTALYQRLRAEARHRATGDQRPAAAAPAPGRSRAPAMTGRHPPSPAGRHTPESPTAGDPRSTPDTRDLEPVGGAVPLGSPFYVTRSTDREFYHAIARRDSIVLVKGTSQVGKTSLLARALHHARQTGAHAVFTNLEKLNAGELESAETLLLAVGLSIADQLDLDGSPADVWDTRRGPNANFERFLQRKVLGTISDPIVWGVDQIDRLFHYDFGEEILAMFRSWHNERALDPSGPWARLTLAIAYATEAQLFITDLNKSPFNVGTRLELEDFDLATVADLNRRHGAPLKHAADVARLYDLVGGHPYLVRRSLHEMATHGTDIATIETRAPGDEWIFGDHLRRILALLRRDTELQEAVREILRGHPCPTLESFYRLRSAGVIAGEFERDARPRCRLYAIYLGRHLSQTLSPSPEVSKSRW